MHLWYVTNFWLRQHGYFACIQKVKQYPAAKITFNTGISPSSSYLCNIAANPQGTYLYYWPVWTSTTLMKQMEVKKQIKFECHCNLLWKIRISDGRNDPKRLTRRETWVHTKDFDPNPPHSKSTLGYSVNRPLMRNGGLQWKS